MVSGLEIASKKRASDVKKEKTEIVELIQPRFEKLEAKLFAEIKGFSDEGLSKHMVLEGRINKL